MRWYNNIVCLSKQINNNFDSTRQRLIKPADDLELLSSISYERRNHPCGMVEQEQTKDFYRTKETPTSCEKHIQN